MRQSFGTILALRNKKKQEDLLLCMEWAVGLLRQPKISCKNMHKPLGQKLYQSLLHSCRFRFSLHYLPFLFFLATAPGGEDPVCVCFGKIAASRETTNSDLRENVCGLYNDDTFWVDFAESDFGGYSYVPEYTDQENAGGGGQVSSNTGFV